jgi:hypothetical protein
MVYVTTIGAYNINSSTENGISFYGSGVFTTTGQQFVALTGTGTPLSTGYFTFTTEAQGIYGCNFGLQVNSAVFDLTEAVTCSNINVGGNYIVAYPMMPQNTVTLTVNVTSPGTYHISTAPWYGSLGVNGNGIMFSDSGTFINTGLQTVVLKGNGVPSNAGTGSYTLYSTASNPGCPFTVNAVALGPRCTLNFYGAPSACAPLVISGTYAALVPLGIQNTVTILVEVLTTGSYVISTDNVNGIDFSAAGEFTTMGLQSLVLNGRGVTTGGLLNFIPKYYYDVTNPVPQTGCPFTIQIN